MAAETDKKKRGRKPKIWENRAVSNALMPYADYRHAVMAYPKLGDVLYFGTWHMVGMWKQGLSGKRSRTGSSRPLKVQDVYEVLLLPDISTESVLALRGGSVDHARDVANGAVVVARAFASELQAGLLPKEVVFDDAEVLHSLADMATLDAEYPLNVAAAEEASAAMPSDWPYHTWTGTRHVFSSRHRQEH